MWPRIGLYTLFFFVACGFAPPTLPPEASAIYHFESPIAANAPMVKTLSGGVFALSMGFKRDKLQSEGLSHRDRAQALIDRVSGPLQTYERSLGGAKKSGVTITLASVYGSTGELILNVEVRDASRAEQVQAELIQALSAIPGVLFAGPLGKANID